jgi:hypothetical protein
METIQTETRNADLPDLVDMLKAQSDVRYDVVAPASQIEMRGGDLIVKGGAARVTDDGVITADARLVPTPIFDEGISHRFDIPMKYVRTMRARVKDDTLTRSPGVEDLVAMLRDDMTPRQINESGPDLWWGGTIYDQNVNYWLQANPNKRHLVRGFRTDDADEPGIARALLSDRYRAIDNYDVLMATLAGVRAAGVEVNIDGADLSDRRMSLRLTCPEVSAYAENLLDGYRSPWTGDTGADNPTVFAGLVVKNSETGGGAFTIVPRLVVQVCNNGLQMTKDAMRAIHLGGKLDDGIVRWSDDTQHHELELVTSKTRDAVATFLDVDYMRTKITELQELAGVEVARPADTIQRVSRKVGWSESEQDEILSHFIKGGQTTALGMAQAVTSYAQTVKSIDRQDELETSALVAAELVAVG